MDNKRFHLELIQGVISRMASHSFNLKSWAVALVAGLFAVGAAGSNPSFIFLAYYPAIAFWILDGYFLRQERLFRQLYDHIRTLPEAQIDFSMNTNPFKNNCDSWFKTMWSHTLKIFYGVIIVAITAVMITLKVSK